MKNPNNPCIFCKVKKEELQFENKLAYSSIDSYPVSKFHSLIVPKRHVQEYFELSAEEVQACHELILKTKDKILKEDTTVKGFNIGTEFISQTTHSEFAPYVTNIGLYNDRDELVAIGKPAAPIKNERDLAITFVVRFDTN